ncbi:MAG: alpha/beta family hydrolase [Gammaproteobacteria bacterium]|nr:alpha/beta family hydrolase [Gammaproteobacteria bacterium]
MTETIETEVDADGTRLGCFLGVPDRARGLVVFAHGSGSSRFSSRNRAVADHLVAAGFATALFDLLTAEEHEEDLRTRAHRFDIPLLARRLGGAVRWTRTRPDIASLPVGLFGASTGAAAALIAAAGEPEIVQAVVSRGGRPDLADAALEQVRCPVLLIVGGADTDVLDLNRRASGRLRQSPVELEVVEGASHLFEEPGALEEVERLAADWFAAHLRA